LRLCVGFLLAMNRIELNRIDSFVALNRIESFSLLPNRPSLVPRSRSGEYHSSSTESDSVMNNVQRVTDPRWRDQALHHVNSTTFPCVRQLSNSSSDSIGGIVCSMECTGTASLQGPRTLQVSQVIPADPRCYETPPICLCMRVVSLCVCAVAV